jgi:crossover junction endodeoxyribonuclease RusA
MTTVITFDIPGKPASQGSKRWIGKRMIEDSKRSRPYRALVTDRAILAAEQSAWERIEDMPVAVIILIMKRRPKHHYIAGNPARGIRGNAPLTAAPGVPDVDKAARLILDGITDAGLWRDDRLVSDLTVHRRWADVDRVVVRVEVIDDATAVDAAGITEDLGGVA